MIDSIYTTFVYPFVTAVVQVFSKIPAFGGVNYLTFRICLILIGVVLSAFLAYVKHNSSDPTSKGGNTPKPKE